ncbi:MAG: hypothetical protein COA33_004920 [Fluviicola sp.]|nr:hypothetical protein [Fluviicola sp.]
MKRLLTLFLLIQIPISAQNWLQLSDYPSSERDDGVSFVIGNKAYCGTGLDVGFSATRDFYAFDFTTDSWTASAGLPFNEERQYATAAGYNDKGYLFGGSNSSGSLNDLWQYDPVLNSWIELAALPDSGRGGSSNFILNDQWFIIGGKTASGLNKNEVWAYDFANNTWLQKSNLPNAGMWRGMAFASSTTGFVGLGIDSTNTYNSQFYEYNFTTDTWSVNASISLADRSYPVYSQIGDTVFVYGGVSTSGQLLNTFERIELPAQNVTQLADLTSFARKGGMPFCSQDAFYFTTGVTLTTRLKETWKASYVLSTNELTDLNKLVVYQKDKLLKVKTDEAISEFTLFSILGEKVRRVENSPSLNVENLTSGIYYYLVRSSKRMYHGKVFVEE